jgi:hypothetical protein
MQYGGVYADIDVMCLKPISEWNQLHGDDAAVLLGVENFKAKDKRPPLGLQVNNWAMAAMPGHPMLGTMPQVVVNSIQQQYFTLAQQQTIPLSPMLYEAGILERTGPTALTTALYVYFDSIDYDLNTVKEADFNGEMGVLAGGVRVLPEVALGSGWEVAEGRHRGVTCADIARSKPDALVCHMYWGTWRATWPHAQIKTYRDC